MSKWRIACWRFATEWQCVLKTLKKLAALLAKHRCTVPFGHASSPEAANNNNNNNNLNRGFRFFRDLWLQWASSIKDSSKNKVVLKALNSSSALYLFARILKIFGTIIPVRRPSFKLAPEYKVRLTDSRYLLFRQWCSETLLPGHWIDGLLSLPWLPADESFAVTLYIDLAIPESHCVTRGFVVLSSSDLMTPLSSYGLLRSSFTNSFNFPYDRVRHNFFFQMISANTFRAELVQSSNRCACCTFIFDFNLLRLSRVVYTTADKTRQLFCVPLHTLIWTTGP